MVLSFAVAVLVLVGIGGWQWQRTHVYVGETKPTTLEWRCLVSFRWTDPDTGIVWRPSSDGQSLKTTTLGPPTGMAITPDPLVAVTGSMHFDDADSATFIGDDGGGPLSFTHVVGWNDETSAIK